MRIQDRNGPDDELTEAVVKLSKFRKRVSALCNDFIKNEVDRALYKCVTSEANNLESFLALLWTRSLRADLAQLAHAINTIPSCTPANSVFVSLKDEKAAEAKAMIEANDYYEAKERRSRERRKARRQQLQDKKRNSGPKKPDSHNGADG